MKSVLPCPTGPLLESINAQVVACRRCPRLVQWREQVAQEKVRRFRDQDYWGRPVPAFGDPSARLLIIGLAPAAHGANRTGRMFTGDRSGEWLYRALHRAGFASHPTSLHVGDDLRLRDCYISATVRCAPPDNKPLPEETNSCRGFLKAEADALWPQLRCVVVLGKIAFDWWIDYLRTRDTQLPRPLPQFGHAALYHLSNAPALLCSYHPSQQNTQTGKLTEPMFDTIWSTANKLLVESLPVTS